MVIGLVSCMPTLDGTQEDLSGQQVHLTILHTSDIHSRLIPYDFIPNKSDVDLGLIPEAGPFGGVTRMASLIKRERAKSERVLHVDSGDSFQGAPIFNLNKGEAEFKYQSMIHLDAAVIGNHEFDAGLANWVQKTKDFATFPELACNYIWDTAKNVDNLKASEITEPYTIKNIRGVRVGIIGMGNLSTLTSLSEGGNSLQATPLEQNEAARQYVDLLKPVVDLVVVVSHLGLTEDQNLIQGYDAYFKYGRVKAFIQRKDNPWTVVQWFGPEGQDDSVVEVTIPGVSGIDNIFGGHLHIVLNPPQQLIDPSGRKVILTHSGAFAKFLGRLDLVLQMPPKGGSPEGAEVLSYHYRVFPVDSLWCNDAMHDYYKNNFWEPGQFQSDPSVVAAEKECVTEEDRETTQLLQPYILGMDFGLQLPSIFAYAPTDIVRRNNSTGGDSPLGNLLSDSMRKRQGVNAAFALTNSLGIRDSLYAGPLTQENMFNVFPFENTINIMYLGGGELQELLDFVTDKSAERGCVGQAQISGGRFTMDCAQSELNALQLTCDASVSGDQNGVDCNSYGDHSTHNPWQCIPDEFGQGRCYAHSASDIQINGEPLEPLGTYKIAVNDYIAIGGSGFKVLKRNTTRFETGISLRDSLIGYMQAFCSCDDINAGRTVNKNGQPCGTLENGVYTVDDASKAFCQQTASFQDLLQSKSGSCTCLEVLQGSAACGQITDEQRATCSALPGPVLSKCSCVQALDPTNTTCGHVTQEVINFCSHPTGVAMAVGYEDGRIGRRVK